MGNAYFHGMIRFNTQPPEGGWLPKPAKRQGGEFQHTAA